MHQGTLLWHVTLVLRMNTVSILASAFHPNVRQCVNQWCNLETNPYQTEQRVFDNTPDKTSTADEVSIVSL